MNPQPTIFISSIISEFRDLRGALKFFLGKNGFRVLMSEEPDFGADCKEDSLDNCKRQIEKADYYLLLIGNKPGYVFQIDNKDTTVTFEEFKHYLSIARSGKPLNLIAFVRQQAWEDYEKSNTDDIHQLQIDLINELVNNSLLQERKIGRWRYKFDKFSDIISVLETNQNGLFLDASRKNSIYRTYLKREVTEIYKTFLMKKEGTEEIESIIDYLDLPDLENLHIIDRSKIRDDIAAKVFVFLLSISNKESLLRKLNRVFNYVGQGEFSTFDPASEKYNLPEYIKLTIQAMEILERILDNGNNMILFEEIKKRGASNLYLSGSEYWAVKSTFMDLNIVILKLSTLMKLFHLNWIDLEFRDDKFYGYRGGSSHEITDEQTLRYAEIKLAKNAALK